MLGRSGACCCALLIVLALHFDTLVAVAQDTAPAETKSSQVSGPSETPVAGVTSSSPGPLLVRDQSRYVLSPGDLLEVSVYGVPDLTQKTRIGSSGDINLPLINTVHIGGMHIEDAQAKIEQALRSGNYLTNPHVSLVVTEYGSGVELIGDVVHPGIYPVLGSKRLFEILSAAGGTTPTAGREVTIANRANQTLRTVLLSNDPRKAMEADVLVYQGETVFIPRAGVIYVVGEVLQPSGFVMENRTEYTAVRAVAMAHGATKFAKLSQARIIRRDGDGVTEIPVPLDKILQSKAPDIKLEAEDIVYVPTNRGKVVATQAVQVAISLATSVAILSVPHN